MNDQLASAIAAAEEPVERRAQGQFALSTGHTVRIDVPVPLSAEEVIELMIAIPGGVAQINAMAAGAAGRIALPNGVVLPVGRGT